MNTSPALDIRHRVLHGAIVVTPSGRLDALTYPQLRDALLKYTAELPTALIVDLDATRTELVTSLSVFPTVWMRITSWPDIPLLLVSRREPMASLLARSAIPRFLPIHRTVGDALAAVGEPPPSRRAELSLPCVPMTARHARAWVREVCAGWGVNATDITDSAVMVTSELVENVLRHVGTDGLLRMELRPGGLSIAVSDGDPTPPVLVPPFAASSAGGRGIAVVDALSRVWGHSPRLGGGKVVWAVLATRQRSAPTHDAQPDCAV